MTDTAPMRIRPSRYSVVLQQGHMNLWQDDSLYLFLPWRGVRGDVWPVHPSTGTVMTQDGCIVSPNHLTAPTHLFVHPVAPSPRQLIGRQAAPATDPGWLKEAGQRLLGLISVTVVECLTCLGPYWDEGRAT